MDRFVHVSHTEQLFRPFTAAGTRSPTGANSPRLGLAMVRKIATAHGGAINVESELAVGSTFVSRCRSRASATYHAGTLRPIPGHQSRPGTVRRGTQGMNRMEQRAKTWNPAAVGPAP